MNAELIVEAFVKYALSTGPECGVFCAVIWMLVRSNIRQSEILRDVITQLIVKRK